ncbi:MAG: alkaline phosphatase D family protein [Bacteroidota bacterium]
MTFRSILSYLLILFLCPINLIGQNIESTLKQHHRTAVPTAISAFNANWAPFYHGVASGDPTANSVIIWTRVTPDSLNGSPIQGTWKIATDTQLEQVVNDGNFTTSEDRDYTVKIDVQGLDPGTTYYYGFEAMGKSSLTGKTKTTPVGSDAAHLRFGVVSCSNYQAGYFNAYQRLAERHDLEAIIHLGDYIYEYGNGGLADPDLVDLRPIEPLNEIITLEEYRTRYSTYRLDTNLVRVQQQHPMIAVWDDHESANNSWPGGANNHTPGVEGEWEDRKAAAKQAYFEWMPIRDNAEQSVYRSFSYGDLVELIMLDTRLEAREQQIYDIENPDLYDVNRTLLGAEQKQWLKDQLLNSTAKWKLIGTQVVLSEFNVGWGAAIDPSSTYQEGEALFLDIWDGYPAERAELIQFFEDNQLDNIVVMAGDLHTSFAFDLTKKPVEVDVQDTPNGELPFYSASDEYDAETGEGSVAVEFATPSITSSNFDETVGAFIAELFQNQMNQVFDFTGTDYGNPNPHMKFVNLIDHGYFILDVKPDSAQANWYYSPIKTINDTESFVQAWYTLDSENRLRQAAGENAPKSEMDEPAPYQPPGFMTSLAEVPPEFAILGLYPNPFSDKTSLHYGLNKKMFMQIGLYDAQGKLAENIMAAEIPAGLYTLEMVGEDLSSGVYYLRIAAGGTAKAIKVIKK